VDSTRSPVWDSSSNCALKVSCISESDVLRALSEMADVGEEEETGGKGEESTWHLNLLWKDRTTVSSARKDPCGAFRVQ
jgi:hypothetical protein